MAPGAGSTASSPSARRSRFCWRPGFSLFVLVLMAGAFAVATGLARIIFAFRAADALLGLLGVVTLAFGVLLLARPGPGLIAVVWIVALEAIAMGVLLVALGFRLKRLSPPT